MYKSFRTSKRPAERQKCASLHLSKKGTQRKPLSPVRQENSNQVEMEISKASKEKESIVKKCKPRAPPEIRHTLASKLRLVKSNPLLEISGAITLPPSVKKPPIVTISKENYFQPLQIRTEDEVKPPNTVQPKQIKNMAHKTVQQKREFDRNKSNNALQTKQDDKNKQPNILQQRLNVRSKSQNAMQPSKVICRNKPQRVVQVPSTALQAKRPENVKTSLATKNKPQVTDKRLPLQRTVTFSSLPRKSTASIRKSRSASDLPSPIREDEEDFGSHKVFVKTPIPTKGFTPSSAQKQHQRRSTSWRQSMYAPMPRILRENLERWLQKRGKAVSSFHHLHCFGLKASDITNPSSYSKTEESDILNTTFTANDSQAASGTEQNACNAGEDKENIGDAKSVVINTLKDLLDLINMDYPRDKCEEWLQLIQKHFYNIREEPTYWECRAALEESSHDLKAAIDCYEQAIIKGALPEEISKSLDGLMEKFNLLHLDPEENKENCTTKTTRRHILDARNIFKSSIIKFALQERKNKRHATPGDMKGASSQYVATPVRRSARLSSSGYKSTPKLMCVSSLNKLEDGLRKSLVFEPNMALD